MKIAQLIILLFVFSGASYAGTYICDDPSDASTTRVYFINGLYGDDITEAQKQVSILKGLLPNYDKVGLSFNAGSKKWKKLDALEAVLQKLTEAGEPNLRNYWYWSMAKKIPPDWYMSYVASNLVGSEGSDASSMVENQYLRDFRSGKRVVLVPYSQGGFHANFAYQHVLNNYPQYKDNIGIVALGSFADHVGGGGTYGGRYINNPLDGHIYGKDGFVRFFDMLGLGHLQPNPTNRPFISTDPAIDDHNHYFKPTYVDGYTDLIQSYVALVASGLAVPAKDERCKSPIIETRPASPINATSAKLWGLSSQGSALKGWFNYRSNSSSVSSCSASQRTYDQNDPWNQNGYFDYTQTGLTPNTKYWFRACAINESGEVASGRVRSFITKNAVATNVDTYTPIDIGETSATYRGKLVTGNNVDLWWVTGGSSISCFNGSGNSYDGRGSKNTGYIATLVKTGRTSNTRLYVECSG